MASVLQRGLSGLLILLLLLITACGGGSSDSSSGSTGTSGPLVSFDTTSATIATRFEDASASPAKDINITLHTNKIEDFRIEAVSGDSSWLNIFLAGMDSDWTLTFVASTLAPIGHNTVKLRLVGLDSKGAEVASQEVTINHEVIARLSATAALNFDFITQMNPSPTGTIQVGGSDIDWTASTGSNYSLSTATGHGPATITVYPNVMLAPGNYNETITFTSTNGQTVTLPFSAVVRAPSFVISPSGASFNAINGRTIPSQSISFGLDNNSNSASWAAASNKSWLGITPTTGITPNVINLSANPTEGLLASGTHNATATLTAPGANNKVIPVALNLSEPTLSAPASLSFGGDMGRDFSNRSLKLSLNTESIAWPWTLVSAPAWLSASSTSGTVNNSGSTLILHPRYNKATPGTNTGTLLFRSTVNGDTVTRSVPVSFKLDQHKLIASSTGIALSKTPSWSRLSRTVEIRDNYNATTSWTATSNKTWLSVTSSGTTSSGSNSLTLQAASASLADNTLHRATITITSSDPSITDPEIIEVALWKGSTTPATNAAIEASYYELVTDPIRPYAYVHTSGSRIDVYNIYTATKIGTISNVGTELGGMTVSGDGKLLYVTDTINSKMVVVDLATRTKTGSWPIQDTANVSTGVTWLRSNGVDLLFLSDGTAYLAKSGLFLAYTGMGGALTAARDGSHLYGAVMKSAIDYSAVNGGTLSIIPATDNGTYGGDNPQDVAVSPDGSFIYAAPGAPYYCLKNDASTMTYIGRMSEGTTYPTNVETSWDGRIACGSSHGMGAYNVWVYTSDDVIQSRHDIQQPYASLKPRQMAFSSDSLFLVTLTEYPYIVFIPIGP